MRLMVKRVDVSVFYRREMGEGRKGFLFCGTLSKEITKSVACSLQTYDAAAGAA